MRPNPRLGRPPLKRYRGFAFDSLRHQALLLSVPIIPLRAKLSIIKQLRPTRKGGAGLPPEASQSFWLVLRVVLGRNGLRARRRSRCGLALCCSTRRIHGAIAAGEND